ncbi:MAG: AraC family transcriptional regulator [Gammaproteobacteria bacterium]|nr:AraC family transcriptional regulator [Gammaproteobacteria bacterium]
MNKLIGDHSIEIVKKPCSEAYFSHDAFAGFSIANLAYGTNLKVHCKALQEIYHLQIIVKGHCFWRFDNEMLVLKKGHAVILNPYEPIEHQYSPDCHKLILKIPEAFIKDIFLNTYDRIPKAGLKFDRSVIDIQKNPSLARLIEAISLETDEASNSVYGISNCYREIIVKKLIALFQHNGKIESKTFDDRPELDHILKYIHENIKKDIEIAELAAISNKSVRSIYNLFSKSLSTTPKIYIKNLKLQKLRNEILEGEARNVTEAAFEYGFTHLGHFSSDYRKLFGELPSQTLHSRRH